MAAVHPPDEEEIYLLSILEDPSGLDLAEFAFYDPESEHGVYRAWDVQTPWYRCLDPYQADQGARSTGKTVKITLRASTMPFSYPGQSMLLTAPEENHLQPLTSKIEWRILNTRILREMLPKRRGQGIIKAPHWECTFANGAMIVSRIPNKDGRGVKGQHVIRIDLDEAQDYPLAGWIEVVECLNRGLPGASFHVHGVPKGVRDKFWDITEGQKGRGAPTPGLDDVRWTVHRPMAMHRPSWSPGEREEKTVLYGGSRQSIDYRRNIYGEHGDATNNVFVLARLMACVDTDSGSAYNTEVYCKVSLLYEDMPSAPSGDENEATALRQAYILGRLDEIPAAHLTGYSQRVGKDEAGAPKGYSAYWGGADIGVTAHPSEFLVFGQREGTDTLELLLRVHLERVNTDDQHFVVEQIFERYGTKLKSFAIDSTGVGQPVWERLSRHPRFGKRIFGCNFSESVIVGFEDRELERNETQEDLAIKRNFVEASTDWLRNDFVDQRRLRLPFDREVLLEFQGQTWTVVQDSGSPYGRRRAYQGGSFHTLDASKVTVAGKMIPPLLAMLEKPKRRPVLDQFVA